MRKRCASDAPEGRPAAFRACVGADGGLGAAPPVPAQRAALPTEPLPVAVKLAKVPVSLPGQCNRADCICLSITNENHLGNKKRFQLCYRYFRSSQMQRNESQTQREMLIDWAICMALWDHHYPRVQEEKARLRNGEIHRMQSIIHLL